VVERAVRSVALFNLGGDTCTTSLVSNLASMYADLGLSVVAADLDPQANLTSMFLDDERAGGRDTQPVRGHPVLRTSR
jgi:cellulose biosynthesis protein BcsQ